MFLEGNEVVFLIAKLNKQNGGMLSSLFIIHFCERLSAIAQCLFLHLLKTLENLRLSNVFRGLRNGGLAWNESTVLFADTTDNKDNILKNKSILHVDTRYGFNL